MSAYNRLVEALGRLAAWMESPPDAGDSNESGRSRAADWPALPALAAAALQVAAGGAEQGRRAAEAVLWALAFTAETGELRSALAASSEADWILEAAPAHPESLARQEAAGLLEQLPDSPQRRRILLELVGEDDEGVRGRALLALARHGVREAAVEAEHAFETASSSFLRGAALIALFELESPSFDAAAQLAASEGSPEVQEIAQTLLKLAASQSDPEEKGRRVDLQA